MPKLTVKTDAGAEIVLDSEFGPSLMEIVRDAGIEEMIALCGGCVACSTCHVYVEGDYINALPPMSDDEDGLLDYSDARQENSRLACQIPFTEALAGVHITMAPAN